jgi:hypothetical protein
MANGKPGDHPITDMLVHGMHPFPADIEQMVRKLLSLNPQFPDDGRRYNEQVEWDNRFFAWERGEGLDEGRSALKTELARHGPTNSK